MIRIQLATKIPADFPNHWISDDGNVYFDLPEGLDLRVSKRIVTMDNIGNLQRNTIERFNLPMTPKNAWFFGRIFYEEITFLVNAFSGSSWIPFTEMVLTAINDPDGAYEVELLGDSWYNRLEGVAIRELPLPGLTYTRANIEATWSGDQLLLFPVIHYNYWTGLAEDPEKRYVQWRDLRPLHNWGKLLQQIFAYVDYEFKSPFLLDSDLGKRLFAYLLKPAWGDPYSGGDKLAFEAQGLTFDVPILDQSGWEQNDAWTNAATAQLDQTGDDPRGRWQLDRIEITAQDDGKLIEFLPGKMGLYPSAVNGQVGFRWAAYREGETEPYWTARNASNFLTGGNINVLGFRDFAPDIFEVQGPGYIAFEALGVALNPTTFTLQIDYYFEGFQFLAFIPEENSYVSPSQIVDPQHMCLGFLEGVMHWMDGILEINDVERTVTLHVPETVQLPRVEGVGQEKVDGYFKMIAQNLEVQPKSLVVNREDEKNQPFKLDFEGQDEAFSVFETMRDRYYYIVGKPVDLDDVEDNRNPFFAPTMDVKMRPDEQKFIEQTAIIPAIWPSDQDQRPNFSNISPRMFLFYGSQDRPQTLVYEDQETRDWPFVSQYPLGDSVYSPIYLTYEFSGKNFYDKNRLRQVDPHLYEFLAHLSRQDVYSFDFSRPVSFIYDGSLLTLQPFEVVDFSNLRDIVTPVRMKKMGT